MAGLHGQWVPTEHLCGAGEIKGNVNNKIDISFSPYRTVNTLRLSYTNQSVNAVYGNNRCLF